MDIDSCIATTFVKGIILSCSSNIIYEYHLKGNGLEHLAVEWTMERTMGCTAGGTIVF